jgi:hypothetical protein
MPDFTKESMGKYLIDLECRCVDVMCITTLRCCGRTCFRFTRHHVLKVGLDFESLLLNTQDTRSLIIIVNGWHVHTELKPISCSTI